MFCNCPGVFYRIYYYIQMVLLSANILYNSLLVGVLMLISTVRYHKTGVDCHTWSAEPTTAYHNNNANGSDLRSPERHSSRWPNELLPIFNRPNSGCCLPLDILIHSVVDSSASPASQELESRWIGASASLAQKSSFWENTALWVRGNNYLEDF